MTRREFLPMFRHMHPIEWSWRPMLTRFVFCLAAMMLFTRLVLPERFLELLLEKPHFWAIIMVFYPVMSVFPQEVIYRLFFFERYKILFGENWRMIIASGLTFGHGHILFNNPIAYVMSIVGGIIFAYTYRQTGNFKLIWIEHALYGCAVFTVGLGWFFFSGAAHLHTGQGFGS